MIKTKWFSLLKYNKFTFGNQVVSQFVFFECKYLFSIILFYFHKTDGSQDRFHTHAFNAISFKLWGNYNEYVLDTCKVPFEITINKREKVIQYFPRDSFHKIGDSNGCCTILFSGPWEKEWLEYLEETYTLKTYNWGRE